MGNSAHTINVVPDRTFCTPGKPGGWTARDLLAPQLALSTRPRARSKDRASYTDYVAMSMDYPIV